MQVGDLVLWDNARGGHEHGIIIDVYQPSVSLEDVDYEVYFFLDKEVSIMPESSLELAECSK